jgi:hypothetical protein
MMKAINAGTVVLARLHVGSAGGRPLTSAYM